MMSNHGPASHTGQAGQSGQSRRGWAATAMPVEDLDLDAQIAHTEQRLIAREAWIRSTADSLSQRARVAATPQPWVWPVVGAGVVLWLGWRWWHRQPPAAPARAEVSAIASPQYGEGLADLPWAGLTSLGWPLAPLSWRERLSPAAAAAVVSTVLSIGRRLLRRRAR